MPRKRVADLAIVVLALAFVGVLAALRASQNVAQHSEPSTYDTGVAGYAALYDVLAREDTRVDRFEQPIGELSANAGTLVLAGRRALDAAAPSASARRFLDGWVRAGHTLVVLGPAGSAAARDFGMPPVRSFSRELRATAGCAFAGAVRGAQVAGSFTAGYAPSCSARRATLFSAGGMAAGIAYRRGRGTIVLIATPTVFDNLHIAQRRNARVAYALLGSGPVLFDERAHGFAAGRSFWDVLPLAMRIAIVLALSAVLVGILGANLPFAPPYALQPPDERDSSAYIASLARMLERGGAAREAIDRIGVRCERALSARPGDERARMLLRELRTVQATPRPGAPEVLYAGRIFARVRKEYGC